MLMAAASNTGKSRSNREEQQKYLTLSSAMRLVCDELTGATYTAKYNYEKKVVYKDETVTGPDGTTTTTQVPDYNQHTFTQKKGDYSTSSLTNTLPLLPELEWLFWQDAINSKPADTTADHYSLADHYSFVKDTDVQTQEPSDTGRTLVLKIDQPDRPGLSAETVVTVRLEKDGIYKYCLYLSASLKDHPDYAMYAVLVCDNPPKAEYNVSPGSHMCVAKWRLSQITRQEGNSHGP